MASSSSTTVDIELNNIKKSQDEEESIEEATTSFIVSQNDKR